MPPYDTLQLAQALAVVSKLRLLVELIQNLVHRFDVMRLNECQLVRLNLLDLFKNFQLDLWLQFIFQLVHCICLFAQLSLKLLSDVCSLLLKKFLRLSRLIFQLSQMLVVLCNHLVLALVKSDFPLHNLQLFQLGCEVLFVL